MNDTSGRVDTASAFHDYRLRRYPARRREAMRAWCAADELLLEEASRLGAGPGDTLVVNDEHGALSTALLPAALWTDSALAARALASNLAENGLPPVTICWSLDTPPVPLGPVVMRVPKQLPYLEYQLAQLADLLPPGGVLLAGGMDKHLSPRTAALLEHYIGPTTRHRGKRKARLFSARRDRRAPVPAPQDPEFSCEPAGGVIRSRANVFSRGRLDVGSRALLACLPQLQPVERLIDLACGNGVLGLSAFARGLAQQVGFSDESAMAIASARDNANKLFPEAARDSFLFHHGDGLLDYPGEPADLLLCNPPFHLQHAVDDFAGRRLLSQAAGALAAGGSLCLVANRHLAYEHFLRRQLPVCRQLSADSKFKVLLLSRRP